VDLENLAAVLGQGDHRVSADEGVFWLRSIELDQLLGDPEGLRAKAAELLPIINAAGKALLPGFHPIELGQCVDWVAPDGRLKRRLTEPYVIHVRSGERVAGPPEGSAYAKEFEEWARLARGDEKIAQVLRLWGSSPVHDWNTLYKLKELIEAAVGSDIPQRRWATKAELRRFDHTANSPAVLGHASRHAVQRGDPPARPMTIDEAQKLVMRLIRGWMGELGSRGRRRGA